MYYMRGYTVENWQQAIGIRTAEWQFSLNFLVACQTSLDVCLLALIYDVGLPYLKPLFNEQLFRYSVLEQFTVA